MQALKLGHATQTTPTIGFNVDTVKYKDLELNIWVCFPRDQAAAPFIAPLSLTSLNCIVSLEYQDVGGQDKLRPFWRHYYAGTSGVIFVVDSSDHERLEKVKAELHAVMQEEELEFSCCACSKVSSFQITR